VAGFFFAAVCNSSPPMRKSVPGVSPRVRQKCESLDSPLRLGVKHIKSIGITYGLAIAFLIDLSVRGRDLLDASSMASAPWRLTSALRLPRIDPDPVI
jgi:hypothetical protein